MVKLLKIFFSGIERSMTLKLSIRHCELKYYQVCSNDTPGLTLTYFTSRSNLVPYAFVLEKDKTMHFFPETIVLYDIKVGTCSQLNESFMSTKDQGHSLTLVQIIQIQYF